MPLRKDRINECASENREAGSLSKWSFGVSDRRRGSAGGHAPEWRSVDRGLSSQLLQSLWCSSVELKPMRSDSIGMTELLKQMALSATFPVTGEIIAGLNRSTRAKRQWRNTVPRKDMLMSKPMQQAQALASHQSSTQ